MSKEFEPTNPINITIQDEVTNLMSNFDAMEEQRNTLERLHLQRAASTLGSITLELALREAGVSDTPNEPPTNRLISVAEDITKRMDLGRILNFRYSSNEAKKADYHEMTVKMKDMRMRAGLTQTQFAEAMGCSRFTVIRMERGKQMVSLKYAIILDELKANLELEREENADIENFSFVKEITKHMSPSERNEIEAQLKASQEESAARMKKVNSR